MEPQGCVERHGGLVCLFLSGLVQCELGEPQISVDTHWGHINKSGWVKSTTTHSDPELLWGLCVTFFTGVGAGPGAPLGCCHHKLVSRRHRTVSSAATGAPHSPHGPGAGPLDPAHTGRITCSCNSCSLFHRSVHSLIHDVHVSDIWSTYGCPGSSWNFYSGLCSHEQSTKMQKWQPTAGTLTPSWCLCEIFMHITAWEAPSWAGRGACRPLVQRKGSMSLSKQLLTTFTSNWRWKTKGPLKTAIAGRSHIIYNWSEKQGPSSLTMWSQTQVCLGPTGSWLLKVTGLCPFAAPQLNHTPDRAQKTS